MGLLLKRIEEGEVVPPTIRRDFIWIRRLVANRGC
jgi:hypothetical protein